jgi:hypothetical protein
MTLSIGEGDSGMAKGGPTTQEGKEVVKWNATRHGLRSPRPGRSRSREARGVGRAPGWDTREPFPGGASGVRAGRKGGAALLAAAPCDPL